MLPPLMHLSCIPLAASTYGPAEILSCNNFERLFAQDVASFLCDSQLRSLTIKDYTVISNPLVRMFAQEPLVPDFALFLHLV